MNKILSLLKPYFAVIMLFLVLFINLSYGFPRLSRYSAVDEPYWTYDRVPDFWKAIKQTKWKNTKINDKPGITVALTAGPGLLFSDPLKFKPFRQKPKTEEILAGINQAAFALRLPLYLFTLLSIPLFYFFLKKLFNRQIALLSVIFISLSPLILGISLILNPDSLLWIFLPLSIISYLIFFQERARKYLFFSGIFLGLSLLTKYVANIIFIYFFIIIFLEYILNKKTTDGVAVYLRKEFLNYVFLSLAAIAVFALLFPATWKKPSLILDGTFLSDAFKTTWPLFVGIIVLIFGENLIFRGKISQSILEFFSQKKNWILGSLSAIFLAFSVFVLLNPYLGMKVYDFESILSSPKSGRDFSITPNLLLGNISSDFWALLFGLTPLVLFFLLFAIIKSFHLEERYQKETRVSFYFILFILLYYLGSSVNGIGATVRYQIVLYPLALIIAAIGLYRFINLEKIKKFLPFEWVALIVLVAGILSLQLIKPFYFAYASSLLPKQYVLNYKEMGDGSFEAAEFLNALPDAKNLTIWSDKGAVCERFVGKCVTGFDKKDFLANDFRYFVPSSGRQSRTFKMSLGVNDIVDFKEVYTTPKTVFQVEIDGRPQSFVKVIKREDLEKNNQ